MKETEMPPARAEKSGHKQCGHIGTQCGVTASQFTGNLTACSASGPANN